MHDGTKWRWAQDRRHRVEAPPDIPVILRDKLAEHGVAGVMNVIGLSRVAILGVAAGINPNIGTWTTVAVRLVELGRLDAAADEVGA